MNFVRSQAVTFMGSQGNQLTALLEYPCEDPAAYALLAHCFTCSKDYVASRRISHALAEHGVAVLRFDFTGLGNSEGDFANTNFSSNIEDLRLAAEFLRTHYRAPEILVGHSLGGSAVLAVGGSMPEVKLVATIAAPADPAHLKTYLASAIPHIERHGEVEVELAGRTFRIQKQFLDDISSFRMPEAIHNLDAALLIFHSPQDTVVDIEQARKIYQAARHPKSFISLDQADHLLSHRPDASYVAHMLAAWVDRNLPGPVKTDYGQSIPTDQVVVAETGEGRFLQRIDMGHHRISADEPKSVGGDDRGGSPYDLLLASLGACTTMTLRMYADHKKLPVHRISTALTHEKIDARECEDCESETGRIDIIECTISLQGDLTEAQRKRMLEIAGRCPVHRSLLGEVKILTKLN
ncbi:MAG: alpha/beta fold hydrolase [Pseudomonadota bacterium]